MKITLEFLTENEACADRVLLFKKTFGQSATLNLKNLKKAAAAGLELDWLAEKLLSGPAWKVYLAAKASAWKVYEAATDETLKVFAAARAPAQKVYEAATAEAWKVYEAATAEARKVYYDATDEAWKVYYDARAPAQKVYDDARAEAFWREWEAQKMNDGVPKSSESTDEK